MPNVFSLLDFRNTLGMSLALHGILFVSALWMAQAPKIMLPVGVELKYGQSLTGSSEKNLAPVIKTKQQVRPSAAKNETSDVPALKPALNQPIAVAASSDKTLGNLDGNSAEGALAGQEGVRNGVEVSAEQRYLFELQKLLERKQRYPLMAKKMRQTGTVRVRMVLQADGSLVSSEVVKKSPYESLNVAAISLVHEISGLKPFPHEIRKNSWVIEVPIEYVLN